MKQYRFYSRVSCLLLLALLLFLMIGSSSASSAAIDFSKTASLTLVECGSNTSAPVSGLTLAIYGISAFADSSGTYSLTATFASCGVDVNHLPTAASQSAAANTLTAFLDSNSINGTIGITNSSGTVLFSNLPLGLYLVRIVPTAGTISAASSPFLVSLPMLCNATWNYDVCAQPKVMVNNNGGGTAETEHNFSPTVLTPYPATSGKDDTVSNPSEVVPASGLTDIPSTVPSDDAGALANLPQTGRDMTYFYLCLGGAIFLIAYGLWELILDWRNKRHE